MIAAAALAACLVVTLAYGLDYYMLDLKDRPVSAKHLELRPSGSIGAKLGILGAAIFCCLYAYPVRKQWKWLQRFGKTKHWLDFHVLFGITAPLLITLHSSFKLQGLAGTAYWLMMGVMWSGFVGRYFYAQIPRSLNTAELTLDEIRQICSATRVDIERQCIFSEEELGRVLRTPDSERIRQMSLLGALFAMTWNDISRPFRVAGLRRHSCDSFVERIRIAGGLLPSSNADLEEVVRLIRQESWLLAKMAFLERTNQVFQLWHVVHRPFSYSFLVLAVIHITLVMLLGYH
jgi:hypothetical protein